MLLLSLLALAGLAFQVNAINMADFPQTAIQNLARTPGCAMTCILNPHWTKTYAPECSDIPMGREYGARLCRNNIYQQMIDGCIKENCSENDRRMVPPLFPGHCMGKVVDCRHASWGGVRVRVLGLAAMVNIYYTTIIHNAYTTGYVMQP